jgi:hypothetical protein
MQRRDWLSLGPVLVAILTVSVPRAEAARPTPVGPTLGSPVRYDLSPPLRQLGPTVAPVPGPDREINRLEVPAERGGMPDFAGPEDPVRQTSSRLSGALDATPSPVANFEGLSDDQNAAVVGFRVVPPDTQGDVGPNHYVQWINLIFAVYDKATGAIVPGGGPFPGNSIWSGFGGPCQTNNDGDPIVLYDHLANRWLLSQFSISEGIQCVALSLTADPLGSYHRWAFVVSPGENNDYPKFGVMPGAYYLSLRDFPSGDGTFASAVAFDRAAMLAGNPGATFIKFSLPCLANDCPDGIQPPHLEGGPAPVATTPGIFSKAWDDDFDGPLTGTDGYRLWEFRPNFANPALSTFVELPIVPSAGFDNTMCGFFQRNCVPQPNPGEGVDPIDELQMYRASYRYATGSHETLVVNTTVDATGGNVAGIRWAELRNSGSGWGLIQEGTFAPADGLHRWMASAAMDEDGNIAVGYSVSSTSTFPSIRYTSRMAGDPPGTLPGGEVELIAGSHVQTASVNRWGDYSTMSVDPVDDCTFWYTQEYQRNDGDGATSFDFKTRIGAFRLSTCGGAPFCGDGACGAGENSCNCPQDCGLPPATETSCTDGIDNDCDAFLDCADADCAAHPSCVVCLPKGAPCTLDEQCCSNRCRGPQGNKRCR